MLLGQLSLAPATGAAKLLAGLLTLSLAACGQGPAPMQLAVPAVAGASLPRLSTGPGGRVLLSWVEPAGTGHALRYARLEDSAWGHAFTVATGDDWFLNWADFPSVVQLGETLMGAHWLRKVEGGLYAYHVQMAVSHDDGRQWSTPVTPHGDRSATEHGFVALFPHDDGAGAAWLDGRHTSDDTAGAQEPGAHHGHGAGAMSLRAGGVAANGTVLPDIELDDMTCDCCPTAAAPVPGGVVLVYRDRTPGEIRDIFSVRLDASGWSAPTPVGRDNWHMPACPVNGPAVAARDDRLAVAWFTAAGGTPQVQVAFSSDGGRSWSDAVDVAAGDTLGRVAVVMDSPTSAVVSWLAHADRRAEIRYRRVEPSGRNGKVHTLATTSPARSSGFPQMTLAGNELLFAWTDSSEPSTIKSARVALP